MKAKQAKQKTIKVIKSMIVPQHNQILTIIEMAILNGNFYTYFNEHIHSQTLNILKNDGYKITTKWREHNVYKISWK